jgi:signal transduction histidine kinase
MEDNKEEKELSLNEEGTESRETHRALLNIEISSIFIKREEEKIGTLVVLHDITREKMVERMKTEFVSLAAHQLRTPLSAIKWTLKMMLDGDMGKISKEQKELLQKSYDSNERMIDLINDLLNVSRIEEGRYVYDPKFICLEDLLEPVIESYEREAKKKGIKIELKKPEKKTPKIKMDGEKIQLSITNLIDNAVRYTSKGGVVAISLKKERGCVNFTVKDSGIGIPKDQQGRLFTKFFRAANAIRKETDGSGLGLFICKNIVEAHGGKVWFESEEGKGSIFHLSLPIKGGIKKSSMER